MKKLLALITAICILLSLTACGSRRYSGNSTGNAGDDISTSSKLSCIGDWIWVIDEEYAIISISETEIKIVSSAGYGEILKLEYEDTTGYGYANLSDVDLYENACIVPISTTQCVISSSAKSDNFNDYIGEDIEAETFSTSKGDYYKCGTPLFKKDKNINKFAGNWKIADDTYFGGELLNQEFEITDRYFYDNKYSFISLGDASAIILINEDKGFIEALFYTEVKENEIYLYETRQLSYFGSNLDNNDEFSVGKNKLLYNKSEYLKLTKTHDSASYYIENTPIDNTMSDSDIIKGSWKAFGKSAEMIFYSDGSITDLDDYEVIGEWSLVDEKLKISGYNYYGTDTEVYNYMFTDRNTLILYHIDGKEIIDAIIFCRESL